MKPGSFCLVCYAFHCKHEWIKSVPHPAARPRIPHLTRRDLEIVHCLMEGLPNKEIGARVGMAETSIKTYLVGIFNTLNLHNRLQVALWGHQHLGYDAHQEARIA